jgi:HD-like signal output (HDOD) protein
VLLGFSTVKNIVLTATIMDIFKMNINSKFNMQDMWKHSLGCGAAAQCLARALGAELKEECFIAGLVHDIGKAIMFQLMPDDFTRVIECADKTKNLFYDSECKLLGINHQDIGGILIELWHLPTPILNAVSCHHNPPVQLTDEYKIAAIVHCADILVRALGYGNGGDNKIPRINDNVWNNMALDNIDLPQLFDSIEIELERVSVLSQL